MRSFYIFACVSAVSTFNFFPDILQRNKRQNCQIYTIVKYPCAVQTWVSSNTVLWVDACSTTLNVTNAPTSLTTTITSTTTLGVTSISTTTVVLHLQTTSTLSTTIESPGSTQSNAVLPTTNTPSGTVSTTNPVASGCIPSSTKYPDAANIPANTTWIIQVTSPEVSRQLRGVPAYLTKYGGIHFGTNLAVQVFFYEGILFALDSDFGVGWYGAETFSGESTFALEQYSSTSPTLAKTFTTLSTSPLQLVWNNCLFGNPDVIWALSVVDGLVHTWFSGTPSPLEQVEIVTLVLTTIAATTTVGPTSISAPSLAISTSTAAAPPSCTTPSTTGYAPGNSIPANTTYLLQIYWSPSPGSLAPYGGNVYMKRDGSFTAANSVVGAIEAFFVEGTVVATDPIFIYGWYSTTNPPVNAPLALGEYLPEAGLTARYFSWAPTSPPTLVWENCGFRGGAATFVLDQDTSLVYTVFDGNANQGPSHIPVYLVPTIYN